MQLYILTLLSAVTILLAAFFAIRYRKVNACFRISALVLAALLLLFIYIRFDDTTQLYGLGILAVASFFPLIDMFRS